MKRITDLEVALRVYQSYLGVLSFLGRSRIDIPDVDRPLLDRIFEDANKVLKATGSTVRYRKTAFGGYGAFDEGPPLGAVR